MAKKNKPKRKFFDIFTELREKRDKEEFKERLKYGKNRNGTDDPGPY